MVSAACAFTARLPWPLHTAGYLAYSALDDHELVIHSCCRRLTESRAVPRSQESTARTFQHSPLGSHLGENSSQNSGVASLGQELSQRGRISSLTKQSAFHRRSLPSQPNTRSRTCNYYRSPCLLLYHFRRSNFFSLFFPLHHISVLPRHLPSHRLHSLQLVSTFTIEKRLPLNNSKRPSIISSSSTRTVILDIFVTNQIFVSR